MRKITQHIIHCSDSDFGDVAQIRQWHIERGFRDVGYHFVIRRDGEVEVGRFLDEQGAHCQGQNAQSIGTCLIGTTTFTEVQLARLQALHIHLKVLFPDMRAFPHNAFNAHKTCPNFDIRTVLGEEG